MYAIREIEEANLDPVEHGLLVPLPGPQKDTVVLEDRDGDNVLTVRCKAILMHTNGEKKPFLRVSDISAQLFLTDCRLAFACSKFDKGGGWVGGPTALVLNAGSKALAARRRHGKMLVGHIRYPWINSVYAQNHVTFHHSEKLRIVVKLPVDESWTKVEFEMPKDLDATALGAELIRRAARFRLTHEDELSAEERDNLSELAALDGLVWDRASGKLAGHSFKSHWPVGEKSSRFGLGAAPVSASPAPAEETPAVPAAEPLPIPVAERSPAPLSMPPSPAPEPEPEQFCGSCGAEREEGDRFCGGCGQPLSEPAGSSQ